MVRGLTLPQQRKEETRSRILEAAYRVFARRGYEAATVEEITDECSIAKGALYSHFDSKEELFRTILVEHVRRRAEEMAASLEPQLPLRESILRIIRGLLGDVPDGPHLAAPVHGILGAGRPQRVGARGGRRAVRPLLRRTRSLPLRHQARGPHSL